MKKTKNSTPSSEWEPKDKCPSCGSFCDIHKDLDENDECNDCRSSKTAEDFLQDHLEISHFYDDKTENMVCYSDDVQKAMIEFAKLHVEQALKAASELEERDGTEGYKIYPDSILTAYPLENIK